MHERVLASLPGCADGPHLRGPRTRRPVQRGAAGVRRMVVV